MLLERQGKKQIERQKASILDGKGLKLKIKNRKISQIKKIVKILKRYTYYDKKSKD